MMMMMKAAESCKMSVHGVIFQKTPFFIVTAARTQNLTILSVFENRVLTSTLTAKTEEWQSVGRSAVTGQRHASAFLRNALHPTLRHKNWGDSGGTLPQNVARMQVVISQVIFFVSSAGTYCNITEKRVQITLQSALRHVMEPIRRLGNWAMCNACDIMFSNRPPDSATPHYWHAVRIHRPAILITWYNAEWTDLAQERVL